MRFILTICLTVLVTVGGLIGETPAVEAVGQPMELTPSGTAYMAPVWSPNGGTIAITGLHYSGIYLVDFPERDVAQLSDDPAAGFGMAWNHEGTAIAARIARFENRRRFNAVAVFDVITGAKLLITDYMATLPGTPRWTRDDRQIYLTGTDQFRLIDVQATLKKSTTLAPSERVIYASENRIQVREAASLTDKVLETAGNRILNLSLAPDGTKMLYEVIGGSVWVANVDGSQAVDLGAGDSPAWSPDGKKVVFAVTTDDGHRLLTADIIVVNADGTGRVNLTQSPDRLELNPSWSPDGRWIAYEAMNTGQILVQEVR